MGSDRRRGGENAATRMALIDAAEQLIREEGYPAVTARNLADKLNLTRQIVHYYFHTMDDVFIAVIRKNGISWRARMDEVERSDEPLRELHMVNREPKRAILAMELYALANHRPAVRAEVIRATEETRDRQTRILADHLKKRGMKAGIEPSVAIILMGSLAQVLALEAVIGFNKGHAKTLQLVDACLRAFAQGDTSPFLSDLVPKPRSAQTRVEKTTCAKSKSAVSTRARRKN